MCSSPLQLLKSHMATEAGLHVIKCDELFMNVHLIVDLTRFYNSVNLPFGVLSVNYYWMGDIFYFKIRTAY